MQSAQDSINYLSQIKILLTLIAFPCNQARITAPTLIQHDFRREAHQAHPYY